MSGKAAIVTGASGGIGAAVAAELAGNGMDVCLVARRAAVMEELATTMRRPGRIVTVCPADLSHPDAPAVVVAHSVAAFGGVDLLVNCAGDTKRGDFFALTEDDWQAGFALKFFGTVRLCRAAWPHLVARRGGVVTIIGMGARTPAAEFTIGGSVNSALMNFTKALADIGLRDAVRVNAVNPGWIATERLNRKIGLMMREDGLTREEAVAELLRSAGVTRLGEARDVARLVAFLASDDAGYIHGATLDVDGGATRGI